MPRFKVYPTDHSFASAEIIAPDAARVLSIVAKLDCHEADVIRDDVYDFSIRLEHNGLWCIFQREEPEQVIPLAG